jgi:predicted signal transduction protein with EAL and GGDEF domain
MSRRLQEQAEQHGFLAGRIGGDEFVLSCVQTDTDRIVGMLDEMVEKLSAPFVHGGRKVDMSLTVGVSVTPVAAFDTQAALGRAFYVLNKVRDESMSAWGIFVPDMESDYQYHTIIKNELRQAIDECKLQVEFQPIYEPDGKTIKSAEALCRWNHPQLGSIAPAHFVEIAEEIGVIGELTRFMLTTSVAECARWRSRIAVAVNLSVADLGREGLVEFIASLLEEHGLEPERLCIEITETVFLQDYRRMAAILKSIQAIGVKTSIDDFGTGYSSLAHLHHLPADKVKIDRAFVVDIERNEKSQQLFRAVVSLGKELGFEVVVEGVETEGQLEWVRRCGADLVQGYVFSRAVGADYMRLLAPQGRIVGGFPPMQEIKAAV